MPQPFLIYTLSRSRTAWLSEFLTYGPWWCEREIAVAMRSIQDVVDWFGRPYVGTCETGVAQGHWLLRHYVPGIREVVVRRPVEEVIQSMLALKIDGFRYEEPSLRRTMEYGDRLLAKISARPGVLSMTYADLETETACQRLFEHCLQMPFDREWWLRRKDVNIQIDIGDILRYYHANISAISAFKQSCKTDLRRLARAGLIRTK